MRMCTMYVYTVHVCVCVTVKSRIRLEYHSIPSIAIEQMFIFFFFSTSTYQFYCQLYHRKFDCDIIKTTQQRSKREQKPKNNKKNCSYVPIDLKSVCLFVFFFFVLSHEEHIGCFRLKSENL